MGQAAAEQAAKVIRSATIERGGARIIAATGASQFDFLEALTRIKDVDWPKVTMFHLDEYTGLDESHPAATLYLDRESSSLIS
jgi:glucosamine-6-phosphate deaminase